MLERIVEKIVYVDRPVEKIIERVVEKIVEKPVYIDRPYQVPVPQVQQVPVPQMQQWQQMQPQQGTQSAVVEQQFGGYMEQSAPNLPAQDHHHIIERPVYIHPDAPQDESVPSVIREVQIIERPVYIQTPIPIPFERPVPVPVPQREMKKTVRKPQEMYAQQMNGGGNRDFPYHNPYPELGCDFVDGRLQASNEPDPIKAFLENFKPFS